MVFRPAHYHLRIIGGAPSCSARHKGQGRADYGRPAQLRTACRRLIASQTAVIGAGIGGLSFFTVWMNRYQPYLIEVTLLWWLGGTIRAMTADHGDGPPWRRLARAGRPTPVLAAACLGSYGLLLALAMGISVLVRPT